MRLVVWFLAAYLTACAGMLPPKPLPKKAPANIYSTSLRVYEAGDFRCSGVLTGPDSALSAAHCFTSSNRYDILLERKGASLVRLTSLALFPEADVAVLHFSEAQPAPYATPGAPAQLGDRAWITGYGCLEATTGLRRLSARKLRAASSTVFKGVACPGDSGGGIWNDHGELIGLTHARSLTGASRVYASSTFLVDF